MLSGHPLNPRPPTSRRPLRPGRRTIKLHLVDLDSRQLAQALLVESRAERPPTSRTFEVGSAGVLRVYEVGSGVSRVYEVRSGWGAGWQGSGFEKTKPQTLPGGRGVRARTRERTGDPGTQTCAHGGLDVLGAPVPVATSASNARRARARAQVEVPAGGIVQRRTTYANAGAAAAAFHFTSSHPRLLSLHPACLRLPPGGTGALGLAVDAARLAAGEGVEVLVLVGGEGGGAEDCMAVRVRAV